MRVVDGFFVSNFAGKTPFVAVNLIMPVLMILGTVDFMFGTGVLLSVLGIAFLFLKRNKYHYGRPSR